MLSGSNCPAPGRENATSKALCEQKRDILQFNALGFRWYELAPYCGIRSRKFSKKQRWGHRMMEKGEHVR